MKWLQRRFERRVMMDFLKWLEQKESGSFTNAWELKVKSYLDREAPPLPDLDDVVPLWGPAPFRDGVASEW